MGSEGEIWRVVRAQTRAKRRDNRVKNLALLEKSGVPFTLTNHGEDTLFREPGKPPVNFWLSTGKWRITLPGGKTMSGGAKAFLGWYRKQSLNQKTTQSET